MNEISEIKIPLSLAELDAESGDIQYSSYIETTTHY